MTLYIIRRLLWSLVLLLLVSLVTFVIFYLLPAADPALIRAGRNPTPELIASIRQSLGLDRPVYEQYWMYIKAIVLDFDFGTSYIQGLPVRDLILDRMPATISLAFGAAVLWLAIGVPIGILSGVKSGSLLERSLMFAALVAISAPVYWLGLVATYLFSSEFGVIPIFNTTGNFVEPWVNLGQWFSSLLLPWLVLGTAGVAIYARFMRSNLIEVLHEDYIRTARAKGLPERTVIMRHGVRSAATPIVTIFGLDLGVLLGGAILTERVFNIPGIGRVAFGAIQQGDIPIVQGTVLIGALAIILMNLIVDIAYAFLDPRVRY